MEEVVEAARVELASESIAGKATTCFSRGCASHDAVPTGREYIG